jgi:hypothetical protein
VIRVGARWHRSAAAVPEATLTAVDAVARARASGEVSSGAPPHAPALGICMPANAPCYEVFLEDRAARNVWYYQVSAADGAILTKESQVAHYDGSLRVNVGVPYDGTSKPYRNLPHAKIFENSGSAYGSRSHCSYSTPNTYTTGSGLLGNTNYNGAYTGLTPSNPSDIYWKIDLSGQWASDYSDLPTTGDYTLPNFTAGISPYNFSLTRDDNRSRRAEVFYLINWARQGFTDAIAGAQWEPLRFNYYEDTPSGCSTSDGSSCCAGQTFGDCFEVWCSEDWGSNDKAEKRFREVVFHEQNHSMRTKVGTLCSPTTGCAGTTSTDGAECGCWEEGRAMWAAAVMGRFEQTRVEWTPTKKYPNDYSGSPIAYTAGSIWTSLYVDYTVQAGVNRSFANISDYVYQPTSTTRMVGSCSGSAYTTCPTDSFYRYMLANDDFHTSSDTHYEISKAFHDHVTDASRAVSGTQGFPWADETPSRLVNPVYLGPETGVMMSASTGPDSGSGNLRLDSVEDNDIYSFLGRAGITYKITTSNLATNVDTIIDIYKGENFWINSNDDCPGFGWASCYTFTPTETDFYRVGVRPFVGSSPTTGINATYQVNVEVVGDEYAGTMADASALAPDNNWRTGSFQTGSDVDMFRLASAGSQTLGYLGCSDAGVSTKVEVLNSSGTVLATTTNTSCASSNSTLSIAAASTICA